MVLKRMVRKLRGPVKKESKDERRVRRQENVQGKQKILSVTLPVIVAFVIIVVIIVYFGTRKTEVSPPF